MASAGATSRNSAPMRLRTSAIVAENERLQEVALLEP